MVLAFGEGISCLAGPAELALPPNCVDDQSPTDPFTPFDGPGGAPACSAVERGIPALRNDRCRMVRERRRGLGGLESPRASHPDGHCGSCDGCTHCQNPADVTAQYAPAPHDAQSESLVHSSLGVWQ